MTKNNSYEDRDDFMDIQEANSEILGRIGPLLK